MAFRDLISGQFNWTQTVILLYTLLFPRLNGYLSILSSRWHWTISATVIFTTRPSTAEFIHVDANVIGNPVSLALKSFYFKYRWHFVYRLQYKFSYAELHLTLACLILGGWNIILQHPNHTICEPDMTLVSSAAYLCVSGWMWSRTPSLCLTSIRAASQTPVCLWWPRPSWTPAPPQNIALGRTHPPTSCFMPRTSPATRAGWRGKHTHVYTPNTGWMDRGNMCGGGLLCEWKHQKTRISYVSFQHTYNMTVALWSMGHETQSKLQHSGNGWERPGHEIYSTGSWCVVEGVEMCVGRERRERGGKHFWE